MEIKKKIFIKKDKKIKETGLLSLKTIKSKKFLSWKPKLSFIQSLKMTASWYQCFMNDRANIEKLSKKQVENFFYD